MEQVHHSLIVEKAVRRSGMSISEIGRLLNVNRRSIYNYFNQQRLSIDIIANFERALNYDFSEDIPEYSKYKLRQEPVAREFGEVNVWKLKYLELLEKYNDILLKQLNHDIADVA